jgi:hypothetical protein
MVDGCKRECVKLATNNQQQKPRKAPSGNPQSNSRHNEKNRDIRGPGVLSSSKEVSHWLGEVDAEPSHRGKISNERSSLTIG